MTTLSETSEVDRERGLEIARRYYPILSGDDVQSLGLAIAQALSERARECAEIAETFNLDGALEQDKLPKGWAGCRRSIGKAIRSRYALDGEG